jgi:hypothetical protein
LEEREQQLLAASPTLDFLRKRLTPPSSLPRNQVPEWASSYIDYKGLKKLIKAAAESSAKSGKKADLAGAISSSG